MEHTFMSLLAIYTSSLGNYLFKSFCSFLKLRYSCCAILTEFQVYGTVIRIFLRLYSIYTYYKILEKYWFYPLCCTIYPCGILVLYRAVCAF